MRLPLPAEALGEESLPTPDSIERDAIAAEIVGEMNRNLGDRNRLNAFTRVHGEAIIIDLTPQIEERAFEEQQDAEAAGLSAQLTNTFGKDPLRKRVFGI